MQSKLKLLFFIALYVLKISECAKDYCKGNNCEKPKQHILCKFQSQEPAERCKNFEVTVKSDVDRQALLDKMNSRRNKVASGAIRSLPASADMMKLDWNYELEVFAQRWANQCVQFKSPDLKDSCRNLHDTPVEQNIATIYGESPGLAVTALVDVWYMELLSINSTILTRFKDSMESGFNHFEYFSQLVWAKTTHVGCGGVKFKDRDSGNRTVYRLVCNFAPGGNQLNHSVYSYGVPCSRCPENSVCDETFTALCGKIPKQITPNITTQEKKNPELEPSIIADKANNDSTEAIETNDSENEEPFTPYNFFDRVKDYTRQLITTAPTKYHCKDSVDDFLSLIRERLSSDPGLKDILFNTKPAFTSALNESTSEDPQVAAFINKLYSKKIAHTTTRIPESDLFNSTLLVDLVEAIIFRSSGGISKMEVPITEHSLPYSNVSPVRIQAELAQIEQNKDFTGHYFFPEDIPDEDEEATSETTEAYYDLSNHPIKDIIMEIEDIKKNAVTKDFLDDIFENDPVVDSTTSFKVLSPDDMNLYKSGRKVMKKFLEDITEQNPK